MIEHKCNIPGATLQKIFFLCITKKDLAKTALLISAKYFQNRIIMFCLEFWFQSIYLGFGIEVLLFAFGIMK
jgi:hypothetical protein